MTIFSLGGSTEKTSAFLKKMQDEDMMVSSLESLAQQGVAALEAATPMDSGATAAAWSYEIEVTSEKTTISWLNSNVVDGVHVAILLQFGHGTGTGGYVAGRDYINPALQPIFDEISDEVWKKVTSA